MATTLSSRSDNIQSLCPKISKMPLDTTAENIWKNDVISKRFNLQTASTTWSSKQENLDHSWILLLKKGYASLHYQKLNLNLNLKKSRVDFYSNSSLGIWKNNDKHSPLGNVHISRLKRNLNQYVYDISNKTNHLSIAFTSRENHLTHCIYKIATILQSTGMFWVVLVSIMQKYTTQELRCWMIQQKEHGLWSLHGLWSWILALLLFRYTLFGK